MRHKDKTPWVWCGRWSDLVTVATAGEMYLSNSCYIKRMKSKGKKKRATVFLETNLKDLPGEIILKEL